jgi:hypothetical protein
MSSRKLPHRPWPPQLFDPITSSNDRGESNVSLDDVSAPETTLECTHQLLPFLHAHLHLCPFPQPHMQPCLNSHPAVQALPSITREQKCLEITAPHLLNSRGAITKVPTAKNSSRHNVYANTCYNQPSKKSPSSHALATDNNASPFVSYLNQQ